MRSKSLKAHGVKYAQIDGPRIAFIVYARHLREHGIGACRFGFGNRHCKGFLVIPKIYMASRTLLIIESPGTGSGRFRQLARRAGFKVLTANSGTMTRSVVRRAQPALVLLSPHTNSPGPSEIARNIKEDPTTADVPVLMLVPSERARAHVYPTEACATVDASDDELLRTMRLLASNSRRVRYQPKPTGPLEGHLDHDSLPDVLQFLFAARKTGRVTIRNGAPHPGHIYIEGGNVVHAEHADRYGLEAFKKMCFASHGRFKFEPDERTPHRTMLEGGIELLLQSARAKDDEDRSAARIQAHTPRDMRHRSYAKARGSSLPSLTRLAGESDAKKTTPFSGLIAKISRAMKS